MGIVKHAQRAQAIQYIMSPQVNAISVQILTFLIMETLSPVHPAIVQISTPVLQNLQEIVVTNKKSLHIKMKTFNLILNLNLS